MSLQIRKLKRLTIRSGSFSAIDKPWWTLLIFLYGLLVLPVTAAENSSDARTLTLTNAIQVRQLSFAEAERDRPVRIEGVVTYVDSNWDMLFVQDATCGVFVDPIGLYRPLQAGARVEVEGLVEPGAYNAFVSRGRIRVKGQGTLPPAPLRSIRALADGTDDGKRVEVNGTVRSVTLEDGHLLLQLNEENEWIKVFVDSSAEDSLRRLVNAKVRVQGVCTVKADERREVLSVQLFVPDATFVIVQEPAAEDLFTLPIRSIKELTNPDGAAKLTNQIRVQGVVQSSAEGSSILVRDLTGSIQIESSQTNGLKPGLLVDVIGSPIQRNSMTVLNEVTLRRIGIVGTNDLALATSSASGGPVLTAVKQVRNLKAEEAALGHSVRIRGVVTYYDPEWGTLFVQDGTAGIYVDAHGPKLDLELGEWIELEGATAPGNFAPIITRPRFRNFGHAPLPSARLSSLPELLLGTKDSQWLAMSGVVHAAKLQHGHLTMDVVEDGGHFEVVIPNLWNKKTPTDLVDAKVRLEGVCGTIFNQRGQLVGVRLFVPSLEFVKLRHNGSADPFSLPVRSINSLLRFSGGEEMSHRLHVQGTVTFHKPKKFLFVQDESGGLLIKTEQDGSFEVGDHLDVVGFAATGHYTPVLTQATVRKSGAGKPIAPRAVTAEQALSADFAKDIFDAKLVQIQGRLIDLAVRPREKVMVLQQDSTVFNASLADEAKEQLRSFPRVGSLVRLIGVCSVQMDETHTPNSFQIYLRSLRDITVLQTPSWWNVRRTMWTLGIMGAIIAITFGWIVALRRRVEVQTELIQKRLEALRESEERNRLVVDTALDAVITMDVTGQITAWNKQAEKAFGWTQAEALGRKLSTTIIPERFRETHEQGLRRVLQGGASTMLNRRIEMPAVRRDGQEIPVELAIASVRLANNSYFTAFLRDITERKQKEEELQRTRAFLNSVIENLPITIFIKEAKDLRFVLWNKAGEKLLGYSNDELIGKNDYDFFPKEAADNFTGKDRETLAKGQLVRIEEETIQTRCLGKRILRTQKVPIFDEAGKPAYLLGISEDITDRKQAEADLERIHRQLMVASRQAGMAEVATGVLHNVGNVLNSANVSVTLLANQIRKLRSASLSRVAAMLREHGDDLGAFMTTDPKGKQLPSYLEQLAEHVAAEQNGLLNELAQLQKNIEHIKEIVAMQQNYARISGVSEKVKMTDLVEDALRINAGALARHEVQLFREYNSHDPEIFVDKHKVLQILVNLIGNAKYACDASGRPDKRLTLRVTNGDAHVRIAVIDNGVGIPPENLTRIFGHGFTTRKDGHGFGLHSGALAAKELGGSLSAHSDGISRGATFILELPLQLPGGANG